MTIQRVMTASGATRVTGVGYEPKGRVEHEGARAHGGPLLAEDIVVLCGGSLASNAELRRPRRRSGRSRAIRPKRRSWSPSASSGSTERRERRFERVREIPFTSERKMMSTIELDHEHGDELVRDQQGRAGRAARPLHRVRDGHGRRAARRRAPRSAFSPTSTRCPTRRCARSRSPTGRSRRTRTRRR